MGQSDEDGNSFAIPDLWKPSLFEPSQIEAGTLQTEIWDASNHDIDLGQELRSEGDTPFKFSSCLGLALPTDFSSFEYGPLELPATVELLYESTNDSTEDAESVEEDPWSDVNVLIQSERPSQFKSWDIFYDKAFRESRTAYLSEGGPLSFDAAIRLHPDGTGNSLSKRSGRVVKATPMLRVRGATKDSWHPS